MEIAILDTGIRWNNDAAPQEGRAERGRAAAAADHRRRRLRAGRLQRRRRVRRRRLRERPARVARPAGNDEADGAARRERPDRRLLRRRRQRRQRLRGRHRRLGLLRRRQRPLRRLELLERLQPRHRAAPRRPGAQTNDGAGGTGMCPRCQIVPLRVWDTFVADTEQLRPGRALRGRQRDRGRGGRDRRALQLALRPRRVRATPTARASSSRSSRSDLNTADHNFPTLYDEAMQVQGSVSDVEGLGPERAPRSAPSSATSASRPRAPIGTWFRNSGTTQYGGHAHIVMPAVTGSQATGQAAGAAGLVAPTGARRPAARRSSRTRSSSCSRMTAEDVVPQNTTGTGVPDPAQVGWDQHFGYGRPDLGLALERIDQGKIPPQALITGPRLVRAAEPRRSQTSVQISGRALRQARRRATPGSSSGRRASSRPRPTSRT